MFFFFVENRNVGNYIRVLDFKEMLKPAKEKIRNPTADVCVVLYAQVPRLKGLYFFSCVAIAGFSIHTGKYLNSGVLEWRRLRTGVTVGVACSIPAVQSVP